MTSNNRRLPFLEPTIKSLFALSGNQCAFPTCRSPIIDELGQVVAQIAHIVGVGEKNTARAGPTFSPEQLREPSNLLLLCYAHHKATNDETTYPVERMLRMKEQHEQRFSALTASLLATDYEDVTTATRFAAPGDIGALEARDYPESVIGANDQHLLAALQQLARVPIQLRSILATVIELGVDEDGLAWRADDNLVRRTLGNPGAQYNADVESLCELGLLYRAYDGREDEPGSNGLLELVTSYKERFFIKEGVLLALSTAMHEQLATPHTLFVRLDWRCFEG
ncbi:hypothetical protein [Pseudokineococcus sp. 1T1Z-3]|uniref:hypothetical protein n=1 Tax=Pseudokineococcus sp. 1T1Z-3 TaxID=3132745 RepID=UPI0030A6341A